MLDDLREVVAAVDEGRRQVLAEEAVGEEDAGDDRQRQAHQPARRLEDQRDQHAPTARSAGVRKPAAADQVGVEDPVVDAGAEAEQPEQPEPRPAGRASSPAGWRSARSRAAAGSPRASPGRPGSAGCRRRRRRAGRPRRRRRCRRRPGRRAPRRSPAAGPRPAAVVAGAGGARHRCGIGRSVHQPGLAVVALGARMQRHRHAFERLRRSIALAAAWAAASWSRFSNSSFVIW